MFWIELILLFALFFFICYSNTGSNDKNIRAYASYPDEVQALVRKDPQLKSKIRESSLAKTFISNLILFGIILFVFGLFIRTPDFLHNFLALTILGQGVNAFDFLVIDLMWWRNSPRIRFNGINATPEMYKDPSKHAGSFLRALVLFLIIAVVDGFLLTLF